MADFPSGVAVVVNLSARHLSVPDCAAVLHQAALDAGITPASVDLELTETSRLDVGTTHVPAVVKDLRRIGFGMWLDDFGTGWSSLEYLLWLSVDGIKIDRAVTLALGTPVGNALTSAVTGLAAAIGLRTTIEGIETQQQARVARSLGCDQAQGYLWARPAPAADINFTLPVPAADIGGA